MSFEGLPQLRYMLPRDFRKEFSNQLFVIVVAISETGRVIFVKPAGNSRTWELPGGHVGLDETPLAASAREFHEETGRPLYNLVPVATVRNIDATKAKHSTAFLVAGIAGPIAARQTRVTEILDTMDCEKLPEETTFGSRWNAQLITLALRTLQARLSARIWNHNSDFLEAETTTSDREVHYGPLIPGESRLCLFPPLIGARVLDVGCGSGHNLAAMRHNGATSGVGLDISERQIMKAKALLNDDRFTLNVGDMDTNIWSTNAEFDVALSVFSIQFCSDVHNLFKRIAAKVVKGGYFIFATDHPLRIGKWADGELKVPDWYCSRKRLRQWRDLNGETIGNEYFHSVFSLPTLIGALFSAGFSCERLEEPQALPLSEIDAAPQVGSYYLSRHSELSCVPVAIIIRARRNI